MMTTGQKREFLKVLDELEAKLEGSMWWYDILSIGMPMA